MKFTLWFSKLAASKNTRSMSKVMKWYIWQLWLISMSQMNPRICDSSGQPCCTLGVHAFQRGFGSSLCSWNAWLTPLPLLLQDATEPPRWRQPEHYTMHRDQHDTEEGEACVKGECWSWGAHGGCAFSQKSPRASTAVRELNSLRPLLDRTDQKVVYRYWDLVI